MTRLGNLAVLPARPCGVHAIDRDDTFGARDCVCGHGAASPPAQGAYPRAKIGVVLAGAFHARTRQGSALVGAGAILLGNAGADYEYRHVVDGGDRSLVFYPPDDVLGELAGAGFRHVTVPASAGSAATVALARHALCTGEPEALREAALAASALAVAADGARFDAAADVRPIAEALRFIEAHHADDCSLAALAERAGLSSFHFLRRFRAATGQTPRQVVIATRLGAAATRLRTTRAPILEIALDVGFGDLSHFNASFARAFGMSPGRYRAQA